MLKKKQIEKEIIEAERTFNFQEGYKILYVPWRTINTSGVALISLNPGVPPENADLRVISDERGNSYEKDKYITKSPLTDQFLQLSVFLDIKPLNILTGAMHPFRSHKWNDFSKEQKEIGLEIGTNFWVKAIGKQVKLVITLGNVVTKTLVKELKASLELEIPSGWGKTKLRRYRTDTLKIINLPHLSSYKIFSRENCKLPLKEIFDF